MCTSTYRTGTFECILDVEKTCIVLNGRPGGKVMAVFLSYNPPKQFLK